jgi:perosamine synthetase
MSFSQPIEHHVCSAGKTQMNSAIDKVLECLLSGLPPARPIPLHEPSFDSDDWHRVKDCLDSGWVSSVGKYVDAFESALTSSTGVRHAIATVNGTAALHASLVVAGVKPGDEVLVPALTFVGTANPVAAMGAHAHFVDCARDTLGVDPSALALHLDKTTSMRDGRCINNHTGRAVRALIVTHVLGHICDMERLGDLARRHGLALVEDAAEALGSQRNGCHAGHWGHLATLSFNGNKIVTTGGGGAILVQDDELAHRVRHLTTTAKIKHPWAFQHDEIGFNYRMPNLNAALGVAQLTRLGDLVDAKRRLSVRYAHLFADIAGVEYYSEVPGNKGNQWLCLLLLENSAERDALLSAAHAEDLLLRPFWTPLNRLPMYASCPSAPLPVTSELFDRGVCLPSSPALAVARTE